MVARERLRVKDPVVDHWPYHKAKWTVMSAQVLMRGDRRMEAESYLAQGYGVRLAITSKHKGWSQLQVHAKTIHPHRTKATIVSRAHGVPFLAAMQAFDIRPVPRKWLATSKIAHAESLLVTAGQILVSRSGSVGKSLIASNAHEGKLISDDLIRIVPRDPSHWGWIFAYLKAPYTRAMMSSARYGHIIKHLETTHLDVLPVIELSAKQLADFQESAQRCLELRDEGLKLTVQAEALYEKALGYTPGDLANMKQLSVSVVSSSYLVSAGSKRLDASYYSEIANRLRRLIRERANEVVNLGDCGVEIWVPGRYKRVPASNGVVFMDSSDLFKVNPDPAKILQDCRFGVSLRPTTPCKAELLC